MRFNKPNLFWSSASLSELLTHCGSCIGAWGPIRKRMKENRNVDSSSARGKRWGEKERMACSTKQQLHITRLNKEENIYIQTEQVKNWNWKFWKHHTHCVFKYNWSVEYKTKTKHTKWRLKKKEKLLFKLRMKKFVFYFKAKNQRKRLQGKRALDLII